MDISEAQEILQDYNAWRRDDDGIYSQPSPKDVGLAIDFAVELMDNVFVMPDNNHIPDAKKKVKK